MENTINLNDFEIETNEKGDVVGNSESEDVFIKNTQSGRVLVVPFADVANFYGFEEVHHPSEAEIPKTEETAETDELALEDSDMELDLVNVDKSKSSHYNSVLCFQWNEEQSKFLLNEYGKCINCVGPGDKFKTKKLMWAHIAKKLGESFQVHLTGKQVETRYKVITKRKLKALDKNKTNLKKNVCNNDSICIDTRLSPKKYLKKSKVSIMKLATSTSSRSAAAETSSQISTSSPPSSPNPTSVPTLDPLTSPSDPTDNKPSISQTQSFPERMFQRLLDQRSKYIYQFIERKDRREEERLQQQRMFNDAKLQILRNMVAKSKQSNVHK